MSGLKQIASLIKDTGVQAVQTAMSNETAFAKASTLLNGDDLEKYFNSLIDISNRTGVAFTDLAWSMYLALSAGVPQDNVLTFVEDTVNLSKGGFLHYDKRQVILDKALLCVIIWHKEGVFL